MTVDPSVVSATTEQIKRSPWTWKRQDTADGHCEFVRAVYGYEVVAVLFKEHGNGTSSMATAADLKLSFDFTPLDLHKAWIQLRFENPLLGSHTRPLAREDPVRRVELVYTVLKSQQEADQWASQTISQLDLTSSADNSNNDALLQSVVQTCSRRDFDLSKHCLSTRLYFVPTSSRSVKVVISSSHISADAKQTLIYLNRLLQLFLEAKSLSPPSWGQETARLRMPLALEMGLRDHENAPVDDTNEFLASRAALMGEAPCVLPFNNYKEASAEAMTRSSVIFSEKTTSLLRLAFKRRNVTFTRGLSTVLTLANCAALLRMKPDFLKDGPEWFVDSANPMDRRPKDNWNVMSVVFAILRVKSAVLQDIIASCGGLNKSGPVQLTPAFWDLVDHFNQEWEREIELAHRTVQHADELCVALANQVMQSPEPSFPPILLSSSLGLLEKDVQFEYTEGDRTIEVMDLCCSVRNLSPVLYNHYYTWRDKLRMNQVLGARYLNSTELDSMSREIERWLQAVADEEAKLSAPLTLSKKLNRFFDRKFFGRS